MDPDTVPGARVSCYDSPIPAVLLQLKSFMYENNGLETVKTKTVLKKKNKKKNRIVGFFFSLFIARQLQTQHYRKVSSFVFLCVCMMVGANDANNSHINNLGGHLPYRTRKR